MTQGTLQSNFSEVKLVCLRPKDDVKATTGATLTILRFPNVSLPAGFFASVSSEALKALTWLSPVMVCSAVQSQRLWYRQPAARWEEALPLGNGHLGAMLFGGVSDERLSLNADTLWGGSPHDYVDPGSPALLPQLRELIFSGHAD